jgi:geranylgeranyl diphosphate synthase type II
MPQTQSDLFLLILKPYQDIIEKKLKVCIPQLGPQSHLRDACEYALLNGGKRFRPALVLMIAKALGLDADASEAAVGVEYFHTASLIADDLPCMDDDDERRSKPSLHRVYGESVALLATYALISAGYACLAKNAESIKGTSHPNVDQSDRLCVLALENAAYNTGLFGATGGQFLDLSPPNLTISSVREILNKKTVTLFEISFVLGWIYGGGCLEQLNLVKKAAAHFGMAFQIADDIGDMAQDLKHQHTLNIANICGKDQAVKMFHEEIEQFESVIDGLSLDRSELTSLVNFLRNEIV